MNTALAPVPMTSTEIVQAAERLAERWMFCSRRGGDLRNEDHALWAFFDFFDGGAGRLQLHHLQTLRADDREIALQMIVEASRDCHGDNARLIRRTYERVTENY